MSLPEFQDFENRLRKMQRHLGKWLRKNNITCYRLYDADIPEFPLAVDVYEDYVHVAEYRRDHPLEEEEYQLWQRGCRQVLRNFFGLPPDHIIYKHRRPQKGTRQYEKRADEHREIIVQEGGLKFIVNLTDYLDTGLFLDHRPTRALVRELSEGKDVLNLFAYTSSFSVYAADGGAASTTSVDLSNTYLEWSQRNFEVNQLQGSQHHFIRADIKTWLQEPVKDKYDLVILDPPTFSNSKNMDDILDVQRDHTALINQTLARMHSGGTLFFSTNFRKFKLDEEGIRSEKIQDITSRTIPKDFRNESIHYCFEILKG